jgi:hypothetical protein
VSIKPRSPAELTSFHPPSTPTLTPRSHDLVASRTPGELDRVPSTPSKLFLEPSVLASSSWYCQLASPTLPSDTAASHNPTPGLGRNGAKLSHSEYWLLFRQRMGPAEVGSSGDLFLVRSLSVLVPSGLCHFGAEGSETPRGVWWELGGLVIALHGKHSLPSGRMCPVFCVPSCGSRAGAPDCSGVF